MTSSSSHDSSSRPPAARPADVFDAIAALRSRGEPGVLATVVATRGSTPGKETMRLLVYADGTFTGTVGGGCVEADVVSAALDAMKGGRPSRHTFRLTESATGASGLMCGGELDVMIEPIGIPPLLIYGAGHISHDLCTIAARAGFRVTVMDDREMFARAERFPEAAQVVAGETFDDCFGRVDVHAHSYCVVVTRGHAFDLECTRHALISGAAYVGLIGSKTKVTRIVNTLARERVLTQDNVSSLHAPIGLDLGGGAHGEIAVAIVAELIAHRHGAMDRHALKRLDANTLVARNAKVTAPDA